MTSQKVKTLPHVYEGDHNGQAIRIAVVVARFNSFVTERLLQGCLEAFKHHGVDVDQDVVVAWVPGACEIPLVCKTFADSGSYHAVVALGAVIRGDTPHFDYVSDLVAQGVKDVSLTTGLPVVFGVLTTDTVEQATQRASAPETGANKGWDAGLTALEMASLLKMLEE